MLPRSARHRQSPLPAVWPPSLILLFFCVTLPHPTLHPSRSVAEPKPCSPAKARLALFLPLLHPAGRSASG